MKNKIIAVLTMVMVLCFVFVGCSGGNDDKKTKITLNSYSVTIEGSGNVEKISASVENSTDAVEWISSDVKIITVAEDLNTEEYDCIITAVSSGTATVTAKVGDAEAVCTVTVQGAQYYPVLTLDKTSTEIWQDDNVSVKATVTVGGVENKFAVIQWKSNDTTIATVTDGVITGVGIGETIITAYSTVDGREIEATLTVGVKDKVYFAIDEVSVKLAMTSGINEGEIAEKALNVTLTDKGEEKSVDGSVEWSSSDSDVACVDGGGKVTSGTKVGSATITATYSYGNKIRTASTTVNTYKSVVELNESFGDIDLSVGSFRVALSELDMEGYNGIVKSGIGNTDNEGSVDGESLVIPTNGLSFGVQTLNIELSDRIFKRAGLFVTKILKTASDVASITAAAGNRDDENDAYDGYFVLGNNIDLGTTVINAPTDKVSGRKPTSGFQGTFDGRGYVLSNGKFNGNGGLFGTIGRNATVKNLSLVNAEFGSDNSNGSGLFAQRIFGTLENISVTATMTNSTTNNGTLCYASVGAKYRNVVISLVYSNTRALNSSSKSNNAVLAPYLPDETSVFENIYVITDMVYENSVALFDVNTANKRLYAEQGRGITAVLFGEESAVTFAELPTDIWRTVDGEVPYFNSEIGFVAKYSVTHYVEKRTQADSYEQYSQIVSKTAVGAKIEALPLNISGYAVDKSVSDTVASATVQTNGSTALKLYYRYQDSVAVSNSDGANAVIGDAAGKDSMFIRNIGTFQGKDNVYRFNSVNTSTYWERRAELMGVSNAWLVEKGYTELVFDLYFPSGNDVYMSAYTFENGVIVNKQLNGLTYKNVRDFQEYIQFYKDGTRQLNIASNTWYEVHVQFVDFSAGTLSRLFFISTVKDNDGYLYIANAQLKKTEFNAYFSGLNKNIDVTVGDTEEISIEKVVTGWGGKTGNLSLISYKSASDAVATVTADGVITGVKKGTTTITVEYKSGSVAITETITVNVKDNVSLSVNEKDLILTQFVTDSSDISEKQLTVSLTVNGSSYNEPTYTWTSSNSDIVSVDANGLVKAGRISGIAIITVTWSELGEDYTATVSVQNVMPERAVDPLGDVDLTKTLTLSFAEDLKIDATDTATIKKAPQAWIGNVELQTALDGENVVITFVDGTPYGTQTLVLYFENFVITADGLFITKVITTAEELLSLQTLAGGRDADTDAYGGYFVLGNSIDLASTKVSATPDTLTTAQAYYRDNARGFQGTFDGRGYVIANGIYDGDGLFGTVGKDGVVKNVGFYNAVLYQEAITGGGILAKKLMGTVENVYVRGYVFDNTANTVGMIAGTTYGATVKNSVFVVDFSTRRVNNVIDSGALVGFNAASGHGSSAAGLVNTYENVYVVMSTDKRMGGLSLGVFGSENAQTYTGNVITYLQSDTDMAFSGLDTGLFKTGTDGIPYFAEEDNFFDTTYTVNHYVRTASNPSAYTIRETVVKKGVAGSSVTDYGRGYADRWFGGNNSNVYPSGKADAYKGTVLADGTLTLDVYYYNAYDIVFNAGERKSSTLLLEVNGNPRDGSVVLDYVGEYEGRSNVWQYYTSAAGGSYALGLRNGGTIGNYEYLEFKVYSTALQNIDFCIMPKNGSGLTNVYINNTTHITNQSESIKFFMNGEELTEGYEGAGWVTVRYYGQGTSNNSIRLGGRGKTTFYITDFVCGPTV